jgi:hypothetical protein
LEVLIAVSRTARVVMVVATLTALAWAAGCAANAGNTRSASPSPSTVAARLRSLVHSAAAKIQTEAAAAPCRGSSDPWDYATYCPTLKRLEALGRPALPFIAAEIQSQSSDGLDVYLLAIAGNEIWGPHDTPLAPGAMSWESGKQWAAQYLDWAKDGQSGA